MPEEIDPVNLEHRLTRIEAKLDGINTRLDMSNGAITTLMTWRTEHTAQGQARALSEARRAGGRQALTQLGRVLESGWGKLLQVIGAAAAILAIQRVLEG